MNPIKRFMPVALPFGLFARSGCSGIGPVTVVPSCFDYTAALGDSWKQQMLINVVRMRYGEALVQHGLDDVAIRLAIADPARRPEPFLSAS